MAQVERPQTRLDDIPTGTTFLFQERVFTKISSRLTTFCLDTQSEVDIGPRTSVEVLPPGSTVTVTIAEVEEVDNAD